MATGANLPPARVGNLSSRLLERAREIECLESALADAARGHGRLIVISGGSGLGKSRLVELVRGRCAELRIVALHGRGDELEATVPWALTRQLIEPALTRAGPQQRQQLLAGAAAPAVPVFDAGPVADPVPIGDLLLTRVNALFWVLDGIAASSPTAILVDDAHWGDEPSLRFLAYLARRVGDLPVCLVLARRPHPPGTEPGLLDRLASDQAAELIELAPLSPWATATVTREMLGSGVAQELIDACAQATGGNPFYLHELLRVLRDQAGADQPVSASEVRGLAPAAVSRSLLLRLSRLGPEAAALARAAAVLGDRAALPHAAELAGVDMATATRTLDALAAAEILRPGEPVRFIHPLVATAIHDEMPPAERADSHLRAARMLSCAGVESALLAPHLVPAGCRADPWVVSTLRGAARAAWAQGGAAAAVRYLVRALDEPPPVDERADLLAELGRIETAVGSPDAPDRLRAAIELSGDGDGRPLLQLDLGRALVVSGSHADAARAFESGLKGVADPASELARELRAAWWMAASSDRVERARVVAAGDPHIGDDQTLTLGQRQLLAQQAMERAFTGRPADEVRSLAERAWGDGALLAGESSDGVSWSLVTGALLAANALEREIEICDAVIADARRRGSPMAFATASYCRSWPLLGRGQVRDAIIDAQVALGARHDGWATFLPMAAACLALAQIERGALDEAEQALALLGGYKGLEQSNQYSMVLIARGRLLAASGRFDPAVESLVRAGKLLADAGIDNPALFPWRAEATRAAALAGKQDRARSLADSNLEAANRIRDPVTIAQALRAMACVADREQAIEHLQHGITLLEELPPRLERVHLLLDLGAALARAHRRADAVDALRGALELANSGGASSLAARARRGLALAGARVEREPNQEGLGSLTPGELRVVELAAVGHTNREIAQLLFVTVKAVEFHLGNAYRKLGINRRGQLAPLLAAASPPQSIAPRQ